MKPEVRIAWQQGFALAYQVLGEVHTGQVETIDGKVGGIGVTIGARVGALAATSEVLVSSTVKDLEAGSSHVRGCRRTRPEGRAGSMAPVPGGRTVSDRPPVRYAPTDGGYIAYQHFGDGPIDIAYVNSLVSNLDTWWDYAPAAAYLREWSSFSRLLMHDRRGTGLSDAGGKPDLETRVADLLAVLDDAGVEQVALLRGLRRRHGGRVVRRDVPGADTRLDVVLPHGASRLRLRSSMGCHPSGDRRDRGGHGDDVGQRGTCGRVVATCGGGPGRAARVRIVHGSDEPTRVRTGGGARVLPSHGRERRPHDAAGDPRSDAADRPRVVR